MVVSASTSRARPVWWRNARDVTARERMLDDLRESERRFRGIFDSSHDAIVIATPDDGRIVDVNSAFSRIYGHSREQALVKDPQELALFANSEDYRRFQREILERGALSNFEADLRTADGRTVPTLLSAVMVDLGVGVRVVSILRDISERRAADLSWPARATPRSSRRALNPPSSPTPATRFAPRSTSSWDTPISSASIWPISATIPRTPTSRRSGAPGAAC